MLQTGDAQALGESHTAFVLTSRLTVRRESLEILTKQFQSSVRLKGACRVNLGEAGIELPFPGLPVKLPRALYA